MFVHIWRMRARKKKLEAYQEFGRQVTLPTLKKLDGCLAAHFIKVFQSRKPEYLWLVFWKDRGALEAARATPAWRDQIRKFEAGSFYKSIPLELVCESLASFGGLGTVKPRKPKKAEKPAESEAGGAAESPGQRFPDSTPEGE